MGEPGNFVDVETAYEAVCKGYTVAKLVDGEPVTDFVDVAGEVMIVMARALEIVLEDVLDDKILYETTKYMVLYYVRGSINEAAIRIRALMELICTTYARRVEAGETAKKYKNMKKWFEVELTHVLQNIY